MTLSTTSSWSVAGASSFGAAMIIYSPLTYWLTDTIAMSKGYISSNRGSTPTLLGLLIHTTVLFFAIYGLLCINWTCA